MTDGNGNAEDNESVLLWFTLPSSDVLPRPRLTGDDKRRPDVAVKAMQAAIARDFDSKPVSAIRRAEVSVRVFDDGFTPAAGVLKAIIDAAESAGVIASDRTSVECARLEKMTKSGDVPSSVNVQVTDLDLGPEDYNIRYYSTPVFEAMPSVDRSGVPGSVTYSNPWVEDYPDYVDQLHRVWKSINDEGVAAAYPAWNHSLTGAWLHVLLPEAYRTSDPDNVVLYVVDLLEVGRLDGTDRDTDDCRLVDELISQVSFGRSESDYLEVIVRAHTTGDQCGGLPYFRNTGELIDPFRP